MCVKLQNGQIDSFIDTCLSSLIYKEIETSRFQIGQLQDMIVCEIRPISAKCSTSSLCADSNGQAQSYVESKQTYNPTLLNDYTSENFFMKNHDCFNNLIQFEQQSYDVSEPKVIQQKKMNKIKL